MIGDAGDELASVRSGQTAWEERLANIREAPCRALLPASSPNPLSPFVFASALVSGGARTSLRGPLGPDPGSTGGGRRPDRPRSVRISHGTCKAEYVRDNGSCIRASDLQGGLIAQFRWADPHLPTAQLTANQPAPATPPGHAPERHIVVDVYPMYVFPGPYGLGRT